MRIAARERAERGAGFLDDVVPGWPAMVEIERLDQMSTQWCVLAQITTHLPAFDCHCDDELSLFGWFMYDDHSPAKVRDELGMGFIPVGEDDAHALTEAWTEIITAKRAALVGSQRLRYSE
jgi:hypothetical protein